jgi:hypothetical protein
MRTIQWLGAAAFLGTMVLACGGTSGGGTEGSTEQTTEGLSCGPNCVCQLTYQNCLADAAGDPQQDCLCKNAYATCHVPHLALQVCPCSPDEGNCWLNGL